MLDRSTPFLALLLALALTLGATIYVSRTAETRERDRFQNSIETSQSAIRSRMETYADLLRGMDGLYQLSPPTTAARFHTYSEHLRLRFRHPGIQGIGYAPVVRPGDLSGFMRAARSAGNPHFRVRPSGTRPIYAPVHYLEPEDRRNRAALGFDMWSDPIRRAAMEQARDSGEAILSGKVTLVQEIDQERQPGVLLYLPIYRSDRPHRTVAERRSTLVGFAYSPFRAQDLFEGIFQEQRHHLVDLSVFDGPQADVDHLLYTTRPDGSDPRVMHPEFAGESTIIVGQRPWLLLFTPSAQSASAGLGTVLVVFSGGSVASLLLFALMMAQSRARTAAEKVSAELRESEEALRAASRAKDEFLAMLGHELRNPLGAISNALEIVNARPVDDPAVKRSCTIIERQVRHQTRLIEDLLDVSRVTSGKIAIHPEPADLREIAESSATGLSWAVVEQRHRLDLQVGPSPVLVTVDPVRMEQVVTNLLHNAIKYTPPGGVVCLSITLREDYAELVVRDNGVGILPEHLDRIFEIFAQADASIDRSKGGLGLGLPLVRSLVRMHGGRVEAHSDGAGKGSEFRVSLPLRKSDTPPFPVDVPVAEPTAVPYGATETPVDPPPSEPGPARRPIRDVVVVEDNGDARETLQDLLELFGCRARAAGDGTQGLEMILGSPPDLALVDIGLPGLDGYAVAREVRAVLGPRAPLLIALTGYGQPEDRRLALEAGFDRHLVKPLDPAVLEELLGRMPLDG